MTEPIKCSRCDAGIIKDAIEGLCPRCLMARNFDSRTVPDEDASGGVPPLSLEDMKERFPQFEILEYLGRGGMGIVYKARQKTLDRMVAIKVLAGERQGEADFAARFEKEAKTLAQMSHPNIVTVHDFGENEGLYYIVMEFVDGVNLRDLIHENRMEPKQALQIVPPVCEALQYAHDKGVVHRDIKPENLLIDCDGRVKIADFGIASLIGSTGEKSGTPPYMAPEQGAEGEVDHRADIYALGVVLYEMLTGERPNSSLDLPSQKVEVDIRLDDIVMRAMSKEPERRYRTAKDFQTVVQTLGPGQASPESKSASNLQVGRQQIPKKAGVETQILKGLGITAMVLGVVNALISLVSLIVIPVFFSLGRGLDAIAVRPDFPPQLPQWMFGETVRYGGSMMVAFVVLSVLYSLVVSLLCILGGHYMIRGTSRKWAFTGAIACCLTPLWWPLGLLIGVAAIIVLVVYAEQLTDVQTLASSKPTITTGNPRLSMMAVFSVILLIPLILMLLILPIIGFAAARSHDAATGVITTGEQVTFN